jgi:hypothetical protein
VYLGVYSYNQQLFNATGICISFFVKCFHFVELHPWEVPVTLDAIDAIDAWGAEDMHYISNLPLPDIKEELLKQFGRWTSIVKRALHKEGEGA